MIQKNIPILFVGPPGVGKTAFVRSSYDYCEVLLLSTMTEEDIGGLPFRDGLKELRTIPPFIERLKTNNAVRKCLFLDELDKGRREVADTLLTLITHPEHFGIPDNIDIVAAANPPEWGGGDGISDAMLSRFSVCQFVPNLIFFCDYIQKKYGISDNIIELFSNGTIPLLDVTGEGLSKRITCPRTLEMAFSTLAHNGSMLSLSKESIINGLLTPVAASNLLRLFSSKNSEIFGKIPRGISSVSSKFKPYRIK